MPVEARFRSGRHRRRNACLGFRETVPGRQRPVDSWVNPSCGKDGSGGHLFSRLSSHYYSIHMKTHEGTATLAETLGPEETYIVLDTETTGLDHKVERL